MKKIKPWIRIDYTMLLLITFLTFILEMAVLEVEGILHQAPNECRWAGFDRVTNSSVMGTVFASSSSRNSYKTYGLNSTTDLGDSMNVDETEITLVCHLRTINSELEYTNFSVIPTQNTRNLRLECDETAFYESVLKPGSFKTLNELRTLSIEYCKLGNLSNGLFEGLSFLKNLSIKTYNDEWLTEKMNLELSSNLFDSLKSLEYLDLSHNNIYTIPDELICSLEDLQFFNISNNHLNELKPFHFNLNLLKTKYDKICGTSLLILDLTNNELTQLINSQFSSLKKLQKLILRNNELNIIKENSLNNLFSLNIIDLSNNKLKTLPENLFIDMKMIKEISLKNNSINNLPIKIFTNLIELLILDLSNNEISTELINSLIFKDLKKLLIFDLSSNKISHLDLTIFSNLSSLQILKLQNNYLKQLSDNLFYYLKNLHTLTLSNNLLTTIEDKTFEGLYNILIISLDYNRLTTIHPLAFRNCSTLQDIHLNGNKLIRIPKAIKLLEFLRTIDLGENHILNLNDDDFDKAINLYGLRLTENNIENITGKIFSKMISLQILNLSRNKISTIEKGAFEKNINLQAIRLDGNRLKEVSNLFNDLPNLIWLNISDNYLETLNYRDYPKSLQWLDVHANKISKFNDNYVNKSTSLLQMSTSGSPSSVAASSGITESQLLLPLLATLDLSYNLLLEISSNNLPNSIEYLYLNDNNITKIHSYTFYKKGNLTRVDLFRNNITTLDPNALRLSLIPEYNQVPEFYIGENPFRCDCNLDWLQKSNIESRTQPKLMDLNKAYCKLLYHRGRSVIPLIEAKSNEFLCEYHTHCFALCYCCEFYACDCKMECPENCKCYHDQSWSSNVVDCSNGNYQNLPKHIPMESTQIYLDGNDLISLPSHAFLGKKLLKILYLNNSNIEFIKNRTFYGLKELEILQLNNNLLNKLKTNDFDGVNNLKELYLQHNKIRVIEINALHNLHNLRILRIDNNDLIDLTFTEFPTYLQYLTISSNPWVCYCKILIKYKDFLDKNEMIIKDKENDLKCKTDLILDAVGLTESEFIDDGRVLALAPSKPVTMIEAMNQKCFNLDDDDGYFSHRKNRNSTKVTLQAIQRNAKNHLSTTLTLVGLFLIITLIIVIFIYRKIIRIWIHSLFGIRIFYDIQEIDKNEQDFNYDAFICYSLTDESFIVQEIAAILESDEPRYKLCLHYKDFPASIGIYSENVLQAIESSKRIILILSENLLKTECCRFEFKSILHYAVRDKRRRLIIVLLGITNEMKNSISDPDVKLYLKTSICINWGEKMFWEKIRFALPDIYLRNHRRMSSIRSVNSSAIGQNYQQNRNQNVQLYREQQRQGSNEQQQQRIGENTGGVVAGVVSGAGPLLNSSSNYNENASVQNCNNSNQIMLVDLSQGQQGRNVQSSVRNSSVHI